MFNDLLLDGESSRGPLGVTQTFRGTLGRPGVCLLGDAARCKLLIQFRQSAVIPLKRREVLLSDLCRPLECCRLGVGSLSELGKLLSKLLGTDLPGLEGTVEERKVGRELLLRANRRLALACEPGENVGDLLRLNAQSLERPLGLRQAQAAGVASDLDRE